MSLQLDLNDPLVKDMVQRNHLPEEVWSVTGSLVSVHCQKCLNPWPCPLVQELRKLGSE